MAFETTYNLRCDNCQASSELFDGAIFTRQQVITDLRDKGWVRRRGGRITREGTFCPDCFGGETPEAAQ